LAIFGSGTESTTESTLLSSMGKEGHHRRLATERKKEAERQLEVAKEKKAKEDAKTRLRQEEAARFTDQQRLWWDEEVVHQVAVSRNNFYAEELEDRAEADRHAKEVDDETRQIAMVENMIRLRQERETAAREEREKRAKNAEDDAYMKAKKAARDAVAHEMKKQDYDIKGAMAMQTYATMHVETQKQIDRAQRGEKERMFTERSRQEHVAERERFKQADKDEEKKLFRMDEAARAEYRAGKQAKKQLRRKQGTDRMKQQEEERKALEKMEADRQDADKRAFRAKTRAKAAEKEVLKEHGLRAEEERQANNAEFDAQRAIRDMKVAHEREVDAETVLSEVVVHSKPRNVSPSRTEYEARMRKLYGTPGSADSIDGTTALAFINN